MIDKTLRKATAERHGPVVVVRYTGGGDCLWLNMYLDCKYGQMTCDSDIGSYSYNWGRCVHKGDDFLRFCTEWLTKEEWLLRKCIDENHVPKEFDRHETVLNLRKAYDNIHNNDEEYDVDFEFDQVLDVANWYDNKEQFITALSVLADERGVELPDEWRACIVEDYTPCQKRFAEICREVIVPELKRMMEEKTMTIDEIKQALREMKEICANKTECRDCPFAIVGRKVICCPVIDMDEYAIFPCEWPIDWPEDDPIAKANATEPLTLNGYQRMARRTAGNKRKSDKMEEALFGLPGEVGELCDHYKKYMHQGHDLNYDHMAEEAGDVLWYLAEIADALDVTLEDIARRNIEKLRKRYPDGFDPERSRNREE